MSETKDLPFWMADYEYSLPHSSSALKQSFNRQLVTKWKERWKTSPRYARISKIDPTFSSKKFHQLVGSLTKAQASLICIGHVVLNAYLHRIKKIASPQYTRCHQQQENVYHYLFECDKYRYKRHNLSRAVGRKATSLKFLLNDCKGIHAVLRYIGATKSGPI